MKKKIKYNNFSLITGGTSGIGASFAYHLSKLGYNLVIVSNNSKKLSNISKSIKKKFNTNLITIKSDLSHEKFHKEQCLMLQRLLALSFLDLLL